MSRLSINVASATPAVSVARTVGFTLVALIVSFAAFPTAAQDSGNPDQARDDSAPSGAVSEDLAGSLTAWNERVEKKEVELEKARAAQTAAEADYESASAEIVDAQEALAAMEAEITDKAINAFREPDIASFDYLAKPDMNESVRMRTLVGSFVNQDFEGAADLRNAKEDLAIKVARAEKAQKDAKELAAKIETELADLEEARDRKAALAKKAAQNLGVVTESDIVSASGIRVHRSIADNVNALVRDAAAAGVNLSGGGFRSFQSQINTRRNNCGSSYYAIWQMPSSSCRPPTARPGSSQHEKGLAMDLNCDGSLIRSRSSHCFTWLANNAASYGFYNLPSEPWHWSVNGK